MSSTLAPAADDRLTSIGVFLAVGLCFFLMPVYLGKSGRAQPVDAALIALAGLLVATGLFRFQRQSVPVLVALAAFIMWMVGVEMIQFARTGIMNHPLGAAQRVMPAVFFITLYPALSWLTHPRREGNELYLILVAAALPVWFFTGPSSAEYAWRKTLSFNNPNQLGYYSILLMTALCALDLRRVFGDFRPKHRVFRAACRATVIGSANAFAVLSASRSALPAVVALDLALVFVWISGARSWGVWLASLGGVAGLAAVLSFVRPGPAEEVEHGRSVLGRFDEGKLAEDSRRRVVDRFNDHLEKRGPFTFLVGTGKVGGPHMQMLELHNVGLDILFSGGIVAVLLALGFIGQLLRLVLFMPRSAARLVFLVILTPAFGYNLFHNGFRFRFLWVVLALWLAIAVNFRRQEQRLPPRTAVS